MQLFLNICGLHYCIKTIVESMKYLILFAIAFNFLNVSAQIQVNSNEYQQLKESGQLANIILLPDTSIYNPAGTVTPSQSTKSSGCECYVEPDATYTLALAPNDDGSTSAIAIPFNFCMYGQSFNQIYINNNGNVTFDGPMSTFSATAFPSSGNAIVAPFWGDVDTRGGFGEVLYKITPTAVYINWKDVGYYDTHGDKRNTFQLIITDGADPAVESGNVAFCYKNMDWTTGDASGGVNGFGGEPATAGANKGDGVSYFLISRFDHAGSDFDGALGNADGISWLDNKSFYFDACNVGNVPPIPEGISACDTFKICALGDTADISINFLSPENNQSTSITWTNGGLTNLQEIANIPGNTASLILRVIGNLTNIGSYDVTVTATDNNTPIAGVTTVTFVIQIDTVGVGNINPILTPLGGCDSLTVSVLNGPYDSYLWDDFTVGQTSFVDQTQTVSVTVKKDGCYKRVEETITILEPFNINLQGNTLICEPDLTTVLSVPNASYFDSITWGISNLALDTLFTNTLSEGTYYISLWDELHYCTKDTTVVVTFAFAPSIFSDTIVCNQGFQVLGTQAYSGGIWSCSSSNIEFIPDSAALNPFIGVFDLQGTYTISFTDNACNQTLSAEVTFPKLAYTEVVDTVICNESSFTIYAQQNDIVDNFVWNTGATGPNIVVNEPGNYIVTASNICYSYSDTSTIGVMECTIEAPNIIVLSSLVGNNAFFVQYQGISEFNCVILNRWGNKIYEYNDPNGKWDGKTEGGTLVEEGTYFYIIKATFEGGKDVSKQGFVQVKH